MRLETERLILRPMEESDAPVLFPLINDYEIARNMLSIPHPYPDGDLEEWIRKSREAMERGELVELAIVLKETGLPMGACTLCKISWEHLNAEVAYWLGKPFWGRGYMTEAVKRIVEYGFDDLELERVYAWCFDSNVASARVLEKAGLRQEMYIRRAIRKNGQFLDVKHFGLIREDFEP